jgi:hypothetical protein
MFGIKDLTSQFNQAKDQNSVNNFEKKLGSG